MLAKEEKAFFLDLIEEPGRKDPLSALLQVLRGGPIRFRNDIFWGRLPSAYPGQLSKITDSGKGRGRNAFASGIPHFECRFLSLIMQGVLKTFAGGLALLPRFWRGQPSQCLQGSGCSSADRSLHPAFLESLWQKEEFEIQVPAIFLQLIICLTRRLDKSIYIIMYSFWRQGH